MASTQCGGNEEELSLEEKASLDEIMKQAVCSSESEELLNESLGVVAENEGLDKAAAAQWPKPVVVAGALKNQTKGPLSVMAKNIFAGYVVKNFPDPLTSAGAFAMGALPGKVVMAAVVYSGKNNSGKDECGWLLAFAHITISATVTERRIYGECGLKKKFININWAQVEQNLKKAGPIVKVYDKETGTALIGGIAGSGNASAVAAAYIG